MKKEEIVLIGAGGHARACIDVLELLGKYSISGILDQPEKIGSSILGYPVTGTDREVEKMVQLGYKFLVTVGQIKTVEPRIRLYNSVIQFGGELPLIVSPLAHISRHAAIGNGTILMHRALVNAAASVGQGCIMNTGSIVEHDACIGDFCHVSTNAVINGGCIIGSRVFVGSGAVVHQGVRIGDDVIVGSQSVVTSDCLAPGTYIGNPARRMERSVEKH